jgi:hypothetical protein
MIEDHDHDDQDELATLLTAVTAFEAHTIVSVLKEAGVEAVAYDDGAATLGFVAGVAGVPVQVRAHELERAKAVLKANVADSVDIDWDEVELGEREDALPLGTPGHMPIPARFAFACAVLAALLGLLLVAMVLRGSPATP